MLGLFEAKEACAWMLDEILKGKQGGIHYETLLDCFLY